MTDPYLTADCSSCFGLCCTALRFTRPDGFGHDKPAGVPCHFLEPGYGCAVHARREALGYDGCIEFDCLGAGQNASRQFTDTKWQSDPAIARKLHSRFAELLRLHEMRMALIQAGETELDKQLEQDRRSALAEIVELADGSGMGKSAANALQRARKVIEQM